MENFDIKTIFMTSRRLSPQYSGISFGKYFIEPIPSKDTGNTSATNQYLLRFIDKNSVDESRSNPQKEANQILSLLSLWLGTQLEVQSFMINSVNIGLGAQGNASSGISGFLETIPDLDLLTKKFNGLEIDLARQFLRSADVYKTAVNLIGYNNTLSFFLLTVAIECLSNFIKAEEDQGKCDNFIKFILTYLQDKSQLNTEDEWKELLKEIYRRHRSGFTHGGKEIPEASDLANNLDKVYIRNLIDGKEVKTPSLKWFESVVRNTILGFLIAQNNVSDTKDNIKEISLEFGIVHLISAHAIEAGSIVTENDFKID